MQPRILPAAIAAHEVNRIYCQAIGDNSQPHWERAPEWQKNSAIMGVEGVIAGNGPADSHASWLKVKEAEGWVYGPVKNVDAKTHPCMVPYEQLPPSQKAKDFIYVAVVKAFLNALESV